VQLASCSLLSVRCYLIADLFFVEERSLITDSPPAPSLETKRETQAASRFLFAAIRYLLSIFQGRHKNAWQGSLIRRKLPRNLIIPVKRKIVKARRDPEPSGHIRRFHALDPRF
jgi:hypothetical protein